MATANAINYRQLYFEHPDLTRIFGRPTFNSIKKLEDELKANAQGVYSPLGGGENGHLGLVVNPLLYIAVSQTPFVTPPTPRPHVILPNEPPHMAIQRLAQHANNQNLFREVIGMKKALMQQLIQAFDQSYLRDLRHDTSQTLHHR